MTAAHIWAILQIAGGCIVLIIFIWSLVTGRWRRGVRTRTKVMTINDRSELPPELANQVSEDNSIRASSKEEAIEMLRRKDPKAARQLEEELRKRGQL